MHKNNQIRYNSDGEEVCLTENGVWLPKGMILSKEEKEKYYARFEHPKINFYLVIGILLILIAIFIISVICLKSFLGILFAFFIVLFIYLIFGLIFINKLAIFAIKLYQHFAPMKIRERCVFTPTCSSYAIQAIKKYGIFKALPMIKKRLKRCKGKYREDPLE